MLGWRRSLIEFGVVRIFLTSSDFREAALNICNISVERARVPCVSRKWLESLLFGRLARRMR
jgi:hypothetical protein